MADIFISYASEDRARVQALVSRLEDAGLSVWWDSHLRGGSIYSEEIEAELRSARCAIVVWTQEANKSRWVADEADIALQDGKLIPIRLDDIPPPIGFRQIQTLDFAGWDGQSGSPEFAALKVAIQHHIGDTKSTRPKAASAEASIAVLAFVNMSSDPEQEYFSDGLAEELLNLLTKI